MRSFAFALWVLVVGAGCSIEQRVKTETSLAKALVSDEQMTQVGEQVHAQLEGQGSFVT